MVEALRVALIGGGWVSINRHLPSLKAHSEVEVVGLIAPSHALNALGGGALEKLGIARTATRLDSRIVAEADAVVIGTPPTSHADLISRSLRLGKHVLVEKPMTLTTADADRLIQLADERSLILAVVHNLQFCSAATRARRLLEAGDLGALRGTVGLQSSNHRRRLPVWYPQLPLGLFTDESAHLIYLTQGFLPGASATHVDVGYPVSVGDNTPDVVRMSFRSSDELPGTLVMSFVGSVSEWAFVLQGEKKTIAIDLFRDILIELPNDNGHLARDVLRTSFSAVRSHLAGVITSGSRMALGRLDYGNHEVVRRFVRAIRWGETPEGISARDGRRVVDVIESAHASSHGSTGGT